MRLVRIATHLIERGADQNLRSDETLIEEAQRRRKQVAPALAGAAILDQIELVNSTADADA